MDYSILVIYFFCIWFLKRAKFEPHCLKMASFYEKSQKLLSVEALPIDHHDIRRLGAPRPDHRLAPLKLLKFAQKAAQLNNFSPKRMFSPHPPHACL